jgi:hypothetical protein
MQFPQGSLAAAQVAALADAIGNHMLSFLNIGSYNMNTLMTGVRAVALGFSLIALAAPAQAAAPKGQAKHNDATLEQTCRDQVGKEAYEGEGRGGQGRLQAQRFSDCMMGMPH